MTKRAVQVAAALAVGGATIAFSASPALAGTYVGPVYTTDDNPGGKAHFNDVGEYFNACDIQSDGKRAVAILRWTSGGYSHYREVQDADGANNGCVLYPYDIEIPEGTSISLTACLRDGANGTPVFCRTEYGTA